MLLHVVYSSSIVQDFSLTKLTHERVVLNNDEERAHGGGCLLNGQTRLLHRVVLCVQCEML